MPRASSIQSILLHPPPTIFATPNMNHSLSPMMSTTHASTNSHTLPTQKVPALLHSLLQSQHVPHPVHI